MEREKTHKLAVLIDADNTNAALIGNLLDEISKYGTANVKRIYGNWTSQQLGPWKEILLKYSILPVQQFAYTPGKNATDIAMIIDAMDLLYTDRFDGFCLVSSDSDFAPLALRIREAGLVVYGIGGEDTPQAFKSACDKFVSTEVLKMPGDESDITQPKSRVLLKQDKKLIGHLYSAVDTVSDEDGWAHLGQVGQLISKWASDFDVRNYGYTKLGELVREVNLFKIEKRDGNIYVKRKS